MDAPADGLTPRTLQTSRRTWWDDSFSHFLLEAMPPRTRRIVELDCGLAAAAHVLLPALPEALYLGVDTLPERVEEARRQLLGARIERRVELRLMDGARLPAEDEEQDLALSLMSLQHRPDVPALLAEAHRVLERGGRMVAVEPDNLGQRFYFDGGLEELSAIFHELCLKARVARQPADIALGPRLAPLMRAAGFGRVRVAAHMVQSFRLESAAQFCDRLGRVARAVAREAGMEQESPLIEQCDAAIKRCLFAGLPKRVGASGHIVPVIRCVGIKE